MIEDPACSVVEPPRGPYGAAMGGVPLFNTIFFCSFLSHRDKKATKAPCTYKSIASTRAN